MGDFTEISNNTTQDYWYDGNGNYTKDNNKGISSITYNHLNLPSVITVTGKGTITYTYDAAGNKLKKVTVDNTTPPSKTTTTLYIGGAVYNNDSLQFIAHEEGRIRFKPAVGAVPAALVYDYFLKDHLGNVRMVLTEEQKTDAYPPASMETAQATTEESLYANLPQTRVSKPSGYPTDNYTNPNNNVAKTNGNGNKIGPTIILKVMAGDRINILTNSYYHYSGGNIPKNNLLAADIISAFLGVMGGGNAAVHHGATSAILNSNNAGLVLPLNVFSNGNPENPGSHVKAGLNYIVLDENFNYVTAGYDPVNGDQAGGFKNHFIENIEIPKNGYIYVYCSNESNIDAFFDNLEIIHIRGPILEENHYYSYGLKIAAISSKAAGALQNSYLYQGDFSEFDDETGYNEFYLRHFDAQIGRWTTTDPYEQFANPYLGMGNSPGGMVDPDGGSPFDWIKWIDAAGVTQVTWFDNPGNAELIIRDAGGKLIQNLGTSGFWQSTQNGIQNWWLNSNGKATPSNLFKLSPAQVPVRAADVLKEVPKEGLGFWKGLNTLVNSPLSNPGAQIIGNLLYGTANDAYIFAKSYSQGHRGAVRDLSGDYVSSKERLSAGMNTFQFAMLPADLATAGVTSAKKVLNKSRFIVTEGGTAILEDANLLAKSLDGTGIQKFTIQGAGVGYHLPNGVQARIMQPSGLNPLRVSFGNGSTRVTAEGLVPQKPFNMGSAQWKIRLNQLTHVNLK